MAAHLPKRYYNLRMVIVGGGTVGKKTLVASYAHNGQMNRGHRNGGVQYTGGRGESFGDDHVHVAVSAVDCHPMRTAARVTALEYAFYYILCYAIDQPASLGHAISLRYPELEVHSQVPVALVGLKRDLRDTAMENGEDLENFVTTEQGQQAAASINAAQFMEISALDLEETHNMIMGLAQGLALSPDFKRIKNSWRSPSSCVLL